MIIGNNNKINLDNPITSRSFTSLSKMIIVFDNSALFEEFLQILGEKMRLKGFDKYKGGLDTVHDLTGYNSIYTHWRGIEIMFHVSTLLPYEKNDPQKVSFPKSKSPYLFQCLEIE
jgi:hypothetical protein